MGEEEEKQQKKSQQRVESLGWLTESSIMPKKHKAIEGVGASSIVELKAQLYRSQEEARKAKNSAPADAQFLHAKKKPLSSDLFSQKNSGVDARAHKDKLELKAVNDGSAVYAALEKKAEIYEKLSKGIPDEEDKERYCVDFFQKTLERGESHISEVNDPSAATSTTQGDDDSDEVLLNPKRFGLGNTSSTADHDDHKRFVREVHAEVNEARQKATTLKQRRQQQQDARREKLKKEYLKKQLVKLATAKQTSTSESCSQAANTELFQE